MATYAELLKRIEPVGGGREVFDPATGELVGRAPVGSSADVDAAVGTTANDRTQFARIWT